MRYKRESRDGKAMLLTPLNTRITPPLPIPFFFPFSGGKGTVWGAETMKARPSVMEEIENGENCVGRDILLGDDSGAKNCRNDESKNRSYRK